MDIINYSKIKKINKELTELSYITQRCTIESWQKVQELVRAGLADKAFKVGDQLAATYNGTEFVWDIIGINHDTPTDDTKQYSMTIQSHDCLINCQFDAPEALYYAEEELPAGEHVFTQDGSGDKYKIITTQPIPAGGQIYVYSWTDYVPAKATTYAADKVSTIEDNIDVAPTNDEETLGATNVRTRCRYASNNYLESNIRHWLNNEEDAYIWISKSIYDRPSTGAPYNGAGFLNLLDPELVEVIGAVDKQVAKKTVTDGGGQDAFSDKVFLLSRVEVYGGGEGVATGENPYDYYSALASSPTTAEVAGRIKYLGSSARIWWLRSPNTGGSYGPRGVITTGSVSYIGASNAGGLAPACCIV